jgi:hypothetical protein
MKPITKSVYTHKITLTQTDEDNMQSARKLGYSIPAIIRLGSEVILKARNKIIDGEK